MAKPSKSSSTAGRKYERIYTSDPLADADPLTRERVGQLENYVMKHCLWQFNSRGWDRRKQNAGVLGKTTQILCDEPIENASGLEKCYWVDAVMLARAYRERFAWIGALGKDELKALMKHLHARMDWLTIDGSLNQELTVLNY